METENNHLFTYLTICVRNYARTRDTPYTAIQAFGKCNSEVIFTNTRQCRLSPLPTSLCLLFRYCYCLRHSF